MQVGFEAKRLFTNFTGLGNYSRFVVNALSEFAPENIYTLYSPKIKSHPEVDPILARTNIKAIGPTGGFTFFKGLWRSWGVSLSPSIQSLNIFHGLSQELPSGLPKYIRKIVTVHDLIYIRYPKFYNPIDVAIYTAKVKSACRIADKVIAISQQTADDLIEFIKVDPAKIEVVYQGSHPIFKTEASAQEKAIVKAKYNLPDEYILNVGTIEERKNVKRLVEALALLPESIRIPLVIIGRATDYLKEVIACAQERKVMDKIIFIHQASFQDLPALYQMATVFVYPSLFEGFGIPLLEAIESGVPVITSQGSCFHEAAGPDAIYIDPDNAESLGAALNNVLTDTALAQRVISTSTEYIKRFEPQVIASDIMQVYSNSLSK
jgi:glycosyltransferase involved in cell wall biosynthesis